MPHATSPGLPQLVLIRHGKSSHVHRGWVTADGVRAWRTAYEDASIGAAERPPAFLRPFMDRADAVIASDAPRALATARMLSPARAITVSPLLRELDLDPPALGGIRLPLTAWAIAIGVHTWRQTRAGVFPPAADRARIAEAATMLTSLAREHRIVLVVTHAVFRHHLAAQLATLGWQQTVGRRPVSPWSAWIVQPTR